MEQTHFDVIVLGTGLVESTVAGSLARAGKTVLHIDQNEFYGEHFASLDLRTLLSFLLKSSDGQEDRENSFVESYSDVEVIVQSQPGAEAETENGIVEQTGPGVEQLTGEESSTDTGQTQDSVLSAKDEIAAFLTDDPILTKLFKMACERPDDDDFIKYFTTTTSDQEQLRHNVAKCHGLIQLVKASRQFNIELTPKLLYSRGPLVELLISSGVGRYLEFKALEQIFLCWEGTVELVPGSKEDVFANQSVSLIDKRRLMKFLTFALDYEDHRDVYEDFKTKPYLEFLRDQKLSPRLIAFILNAIALKTDRDLAETLTTEAGLASTQRHLQSLGRWGKTAFLVALYGAGSELSQAFCRLSAVYGGVYILNFPLAQISVNDSAPHRYTVTGKNGTEYSSSWLVGSSTYMGFCSENLIVQTERRTVWRAVAILDGSIQSASSLNVTVFPAGSVRNAQGVLALQESWDVSACPKSNYILYLSTSGKDASKEDLQRALSTLCRTESDPSTTTKPNAVLSIFYQQTVQVPNSPWIDEQSIFCVPRLETIDLEEAVSAAKGIFEKIAPDGEFLPAVPNPEAAEETI